MTFYKTLAIAFMASVFLASSAPAADQSYDTVIVNGRVMDPESGLDAVRNVGLRAGKIAAVSTAAIQGRRTIDARGLVVAPASSICTSMGRHRRTTSSRRTMASPLRSSSKRAQAMSQPGMRNVKANRSSTSA